ncbi:hypothetical protein G3M54_33980 [Bacillus megaterium NBRC 15308 = ATCC 14581]|nr:hypothetical protein [Priestia megaterium NBRC 15308 = ATCC 14581]
MRSKCHGCSREIIHGYTEFYYPGVSLVSHYTDKYPRITIPDPAQVNPIKVGDSKLSGTAEPYSIIYVKVWPDTVATGKTDAAGNFSFDVPKQQAGTMLHVLVKVKVATVRIRKFMYSLI